MYHLMNNRPSGEALLQLKDGEKTRNEKTKHGKYMGLLFKAQTAK